MLPVAFFGSERWRCKLSRCMERTGRKMEKRNFREEQVAALYLGFVLQVLSFASYLIFVAVKKTFPNSLEM